MSTTAIFNLAKQYLLLGCIIVTLLVILFCIGYFIVYKKVLKGKKSLKLRKILLWAIFFIYIVVVLGATIADRTPGSNSMDLQLFNSYMLAWNSFSAVEWRNLILNILMFVPLGILIPLIFKKCQKWYITYIIGFLATLLLESFQYVTGRGIFEADDIFNNTLGCIIGYGISMIIQFIFNKKEKYLKKKSLLYFQIPLCIIVVAFSSIFITYANQELGNLSIKHSYGQNMSSINIDTNMKFSNKSNKAYVYQSIVGTKEEALELANKILSVVDSKVDESKNILYDETIVCSSEEDNYSIWVDYKGLTTRYTDFTQFNTEGKENLNYKEVKKLLSKFSMNLPTKVDFKDSGEGNYIISTDLTDIGDNLYLDGSCNVTIKENNKVADFMNNIITYTKYKEFEIISEQEAYDEILNGKFRSYFLQKISNIEITDIDLIYEMDSKGFYQPVYKFTVKDLNDENSIFIPAIKS